MLYDRSSSCHAYAVEAIARIPGLPAGEDVDAGGLTLNGGTNGYVHFGGPPQPEGRYSVRSVAQNCIESKSLSREGGGLSSMASFPLWVESGYQAMREVWRDRQAPCACGLV